MYKRQGLHLSGFRSDYGLCRWYRRSLCILHPADQRRRRPGRESKRDDAVPCPTVFPSVPLAVPEFTRLKGAASSGVEQDLSLIHI